MILTIFLLAIILMVAGVAGIISALSLVPTDLGFTYFQAGTTALSAGTVVLALGLAVRTLNRSLKRVVDSASARPPASAIELPAHSGLSTAPEASGLPEAAMGIAGAAAVAGAVTAASTLASAGHDASLEASLAGHDASLHRERFADDLERDLFSATQPLSITPGAHAEALDLAMATTDPAADLRREPTLHGLDDAFYGVDPVDKYGKTTLPAPALDMLHVDGPNVPSMDVPSMAVAASHVAADREHEDGVADTLAHESFAHEHVGAGVELSPPPAPGLIHDADFAAVSDEALPSLAPISTLEIVGAYDSGGTRFTMYSDGSVMAAGPNDERRFRSLDELRQHIDSGIA